MDIIKYSGILIPSKFKNKIFYNNIKESLCRRTKAYNTSDYTYNMFYLESENSLLIPRFFPIENYLGNASIKDYRIEGEMIDIEHNIIPRSETQKNAIKFLMENESGILQLEPGVGKTVITICMIAKRKRKSFILVHRDSLVEQWKQRILQFTNLTEENISRLNSSSFDKDLDKPIIISTVQTFKKPFIIRVVRGFFY